MQRAEAARLLDLLPVIPRADRQVHAVVARVLRLEGAVHRERAVDVLLVPEPVHEHHRHRERPCRQQLVHRLLLPERVVRRVLGHLPPEAHLLEAPAPAQLAGRPGLQEHVVVVVVRHPPLRRRVARRFLVEEIRHHLLPEGAVVEPVVPNPAVHHRVHRHGRLQRRVRVEERHQREEAVVRDAEDADTPVALGHVLHEPVDRVPRVGRVVHTGGVQRPAQRAVHHVVAFRPVLAADVLHDPDVALLDDHVGRVVVTLEDGAEVRARGVAGEHVGAVGGPREKDRGPLRSLWHQDHRVQPDPVAHRDHHLAPEVIEVTGWKLERRRRLVRQPLRGGGRRPVWRLRGGRAVRRHAGAEDQEDHE